MDEVKIFILWPQFWMQMWHSQERGAKMRLTLTVGQWSKAYLIIHHELLHHEQEIQAEVFGIAFTAPGLEYHWKSDKILNMLCEMAQGSLRASKSERKFLTPSWLLKAFIKYNVTMNDHLQKVIFLIVCCRGVFYLLLFFFNLLFILKINRQGCPNICIQHHVVYQKTDTSL